MSDLLKAEFLRLISRRLTWILLGLVLILGAGVAITSSAPTRPLDDADIAQAQQDYDREVEWCAEPDVECEYWDEVVDGPEHFLRRVLDYEPYVSGLLEASLLVFLAGTVLAAVLVGSEFSSGSLSTQLTFTPKRLHVMAAKMCASVAAAVGLVFVYIVTVMVIGTTVFLMLRGSADVVASAAVPLSMVRLLVMAGFVAALASGLTFGLGSAALSLGAGLLVVLASEFALVQATAPLAVILPTANLVALVDGSYVRQVWSDTGTTLGEVSITYWQAFAYASVLAIVVTAISALVFRRRDLLR